MRILRPDDLRGCWAGVLLLTGLLLLSSGCDSQGDQNDFADEASSPPAGITVTDDGGQIISEDGDDWRTAPVFRGTVRVEPAYPNPVGAEVVYLPVTVLPAGAGRNIQGGLALRARDETGRCCFTLDVLPEAREVGGYSFNFSAGLLGIGLHRLFVFDGSGELVSYGDVRVE